MPGRGPRGRLTVAGRPPTPRPALVLQQPGPRNPESVPTALQEQHPCRPPPRFLHRWESGRPRPGSLPLRSQLTLSLHSCNPPEPRTRSLAGGRGGSVTRMRTRPFARTCGSAPGASEPSTHLCERCDAARFPDAGSAPGSSARAPTTGLAAADYSCVCPALRGSASWEAAYGPGARAPRGPCPPPQAWRSVGKGCS